MKHDERELTAKLTKAGWSPAKIRYYLNSKDRTDLVGSYKQLHDKLKIFNFGESTMDLKSTELMTALIEAVKKIQMGKGKGELGSVDRDEKKKEKNDKDGKSRDENERLEESKRGPQQPGSIGAGKRTLGGASQATKDRAARIRQGGYFDKPKRKTSEVHDNDGNYLGHIETDHEDKHHAFAANGRHVGTFHNPKNPEQAHNDAYRAIERHKLEESNEELLSLIKTLRESR